MNLLLNLLLGVTKPQPWFVSTSSADNGRLAFRGNGRVSCPIHHRRVRHRRTSGRASGRCLRPLDRPDRHGQLDCDPSNSHNLVGLPNRIASPRGFLPRGLSGRLSARLARVLAALRVGAGIVQPLTRAAFGGRRRKAAVGHLTEFTNVGLQELGRTAAPGQKRSSERFSHSRHSVRIIITYADRQPRRTDHESSSYGAAAYSANFSNTD